MKCFPRYPFRDVFEQERRRREEQGKSGTKEREGEKRRKRRGVKEGLSIEPSLCVQLQLVEGFRKDLLTGECHDVPGRAETLLTCTVHTHHKGEISGLDWSLNTTPELPFTPC